MHNVHVALLLVVSVALLPAACGGSSSRDTAASPSAVIQVDGSSTVFPITEAVAEEYQKANPGHKVTVGSSGTGSGLQKFCRGEIDIADASRPIKKAELDACSQAGIAFVELPIAYDGLAVVVHPKNTWATSMTITELKRLWEPAAQGKIMRWSQVRAGWPDREIHLFGPGVDSGTFDYFTEAIAGKTQASRGDFTSSEDDNVLVQGVAGDDLALGYFGFAYYESNKGKLKLVAVDDERPDNGAGPIAPSPETIRNGTYRPLSRPLFIYPGSTALDRPEVRSFVEYYLAKAPMLSREVGYVALTEREAALTRSRFDARRLGTMFDAADSHSATSLETLLTRP